MFAKIFLGCIFTVYTIVILITYFKSKRFFSAVLLTAMQGICSLFAVNLLGEYICIHLPINAYTLGVSSIGGTSGVIMMLLCDIFMA